LEKIRVANNEANLLKRRRGVARNIGSDGHESCEHMHRGFGQRQRSCGVLWERTRRNKEVVSLQ
jgi:hypothetical protein